MMDIRCENFTVESVTEKKLKSEKKVFNGVLISEFSVSNLETTQNIASMYF